MKRKTLLLIDGNYLMYRSYWGIRGLTTSYGLLVNAVYGFVISFLKTIEDIEPDKVAVVFDGRGKTWRHKLVDGAIKNGITKRTYKDRTKEGLENFYQQMGIVRKFLKTLNVKCFRRKAVESDDIIGTLVKRYHNKGYKTILFTKDQDFYQLLKYRLALYKSDSNRKFFTKKDFGEKFIIKPKDWCFVGAMMGDGSDTIEGIKGIGMKRACLMAREYKKLKNLINELKEEGAISKHGCTIKKTDIRKLRLNMKLKRLADIDGIGDVPSMDGINRKALKVFFKKYEIESVQTMKFAKILGGIKK